MLVCLKSQTPHLSLCPSPCPSPCPCLDHDHDLDLDLDLRFGLAQNDLDDCKVF